MLAEENRQLSFQLVHLKSYILEAFSVIDLVCNYILVCLVGLIYAATTGDGYS